MIVDEYCNLQNVEIYVTSSGQVYSCMLNQANIVKNNNKFYVMQLLKNTVGTYYVYSRYGRVGEKGVVSPLKSFSSESLAIKEFQKRFRYKTGNMWTGDPKKFNPIPGKYILMDTISPEIEVIEDEPSSKPVNLHREVFELVTMISSKKLMANTMRKLDVDTSRMPLGKISKSQINQAHSILKEIKSLIEVDLENISEAGIDDPVKFVKNELVKLSSNFWTLIPYSCGRNRPPIIDSEERLKRYIDLLEVMENIKIAGKIFKKTNNVSDIYQGLNTSIEVLEKNGDEWELLEKYIKNTHAPRHNYKLELVNVFKLDKRSHDDLDKHDYFNELPDHRLLIHGSRMANYVGILSEGIRIPKTNQVSNGSVLGLGAYFADSVSKSFNYCQPSETGGIGFIVLCEVALGDNPHVVTRATFDQRPTAGYTSRIALGGSTPTESQFEKIKDRNVIVPCGTLQNSGVVSPGFRYNEYVVYDSRQYRFRYLIQLKSEGMVSCW